MKQSRATENTRPITPRLKLGGILVLYLLLAWVVSGCAPMMAWAGTFPNEMAAPVVEGGNPVRGRAAVRAYGCDACHIIPTVASANATVGPPLNRWAERHYIAGAVPNEPDYLIQWIRDPQSIEPETLMPNLKVTEQDARDIGAFLYTLRR